MELCIKKLINPMKKLLLLLLLLILISLVILKIFGIITVLEFLNSGYFLKTYFLSGCILILLYYFISLYFMYFFSIKKREIPEVLPDFLIEWLKDFEVITKNKEIIKEFKSVFYQEILLYSVLLVLVLLFL